MNNLYYWCEFSSPVRDRFGCFSVVYILQCWQLETLFACFLDTFMKSLPKCRKQNVTNVFWYYGTITFWQNLWYLLFKIHIIWKPGLFETKMSSQSSLTPPWSRPRKFLNGVRFSFFRKEKEMVPKCQRPCTSGHYFETWGTRQLKSFSGPFLPPQR